MEKHILNDREFTAALNALAKRTGRIDEIENPLEREWINKLMQYMDLVHREGLGRMWKHLEAHHPELALLMDQDPAIHQLLLLYDLVFIDER